MQNKQSLFVQEMAQGLLCIFQAHDTKTYVQIMSTCRTKNSTYYYVGGYFMYILYLW